MPPRLVLPLVAVLTAAAGCGWKDSVDSRAATAGLPTARQLIQEHEWVLDRADRSLTVDDDNPVTLWVLDDVISGTAPCNPYRGEISLGDDDTMGITDVATTRRDCGRTTMQAEDELIAALEAVDSVDVDEDDNEHLVLYNDDVRLAFRPYDGDELLATTWTVVDVVSNDTIDGVLAGTEPTLTFTDDGDVTMETGCNSATSAWGLDGHTLSIDPLRLTRMSCSSPAGVMDQEAALVDALEAADQVEIGPGVLTILDEERSITIVAVSG